MEKLEGSELDKTRKCLHRGAALMSAQLYRPDIVGTALQWSGAVLFILGVIAIVRQLV
jgi:hypothetical protein